MANQQAIRRRARAGNATATTTTGKKVKKWIKTRPVSPGDVVYFHSNNTHQMGNVGTVIGYLTSHEVLVKTNGGHDTDYPPMYISVYDREPNPNHQHAINHKSGGMLRSYSNYITNVVYRANPKPKKRRAPVKFYQVDREVLPEVLSGEHEVPDGHKVVLVDQNGATANGAATP